jgi:hypothetical protein
MNKHYFLLALSLCCFISPILCQEEKMITDKPDQSDGTATLEKKEMQLEASFHYNYFENGKAAFITSALLRYGLMKHFELRLLVEQGFERNRFMSETTQAGYPVALSAKIAILEEKEVLPAISLISYLQLPITNFSHEPNCWSAGFIMAAEKKIEPFTITQNGGALQETFEYTWMFNATGNIKWDLSKKTAVFAEYFAQYGKEESPTHNIDGGMLFHLSRKFVTHFAAGGTVHHMPHNYFVNSGFAVNIH